MPAGERCEAFQLQADEERAARFTRAAGNGNTNPISIWMASKYDNPAATDTFVKKHLQNMKEGAARRDLMVHLPGHDQDEANRPSRNYKYMEQRALNQTSAPGRRPQLGTPAYFLAEYNE